MQRYFRMFQGGDLWRGRWRDQAPALAEIVRQVTGATCLLPTSSARAALRMAVEIAGLGRHDAVLIPRYVSACVREALDQRGMPVLTAARPVAVLLFHQWGFPQDLPRVRAGLAACGDPLVIEDCAHGCVGEYAGESVGSIGAVTIYSLPKLFGCTYGGFLRVNRSEWQESARARWSAAPALAGPRAWMAAWRYWWLSRQRFVDADGPSAQRARALYDALLCFPRGGAIYGDVPGSMAAWQARCLRQHERFQRCLDAIGTATPLLLPGDRIETLTPLAFPYLCDDSERRTRLVSSLAREGILVDTYHFDVARNCFAPDFRPCVPIPLHDGVTDEQFARVVKGLSS